MPYAAYSVVRYAACLLLPPYADYAAATRARYAFAAERYGSIYSAIACCCHVVCRYSAAGATICYAADMPCYAKIWLPCCYAADDDAAMLHAACFTLTLVRMSP